MSKEQTPIEKFISLNLDTSDITLALELKKFVETNYITKVEAQAKVLEALEEVKNSVWETGISKSEYDIFCNQIETEVKPRIVKSI